MNETLSLVELVAYSLTIAVASLVTVVAFYHDFGTINKSNLKNIANNVLFWVYVLYVVAVILTIFRLIVLAHTDNDEYRLMFTITYNWAASLIVCVQCIMPMRLLELHRNILNGNVVFAVENNNLRLLLQILGCWVVLLGGTILAYCLQSSLEMLLLIWRVFFMLNAAVEGFVLIRCLALTKLQNDGFNKRYFWFVQCTAWMRGGIIATLILRYVNIIERPFILSVSHLFFVITGLLFYNIQILKKTTKDLTSVRIDSSG